MTHKHGRVSNSVLNSRDGAGSPSILVVDDCLGLAKAVTLILSASGYRGVSVSCAQRALDYLFSVPSVRLLICGCRISPFNGLELAAALRAQAWQGGLVLMAGSPIEYSSAQDFLAILRKPFTIPALRAAVTRALPFRGAPFYSS